MTHVPDVPDQLDDEDQKNRCRMLELAVLLRALLDATWKDEIGLARNMDDRRRRADFRIDRLRRIEARSWLLSQNPAHRRHVESIADAAGLPDGWVWRLVNRFVEEGADPAPLHALQDMLSERPGSKKFDLDVAFVP